MGIDQVQQFVIRKQTQFASALAHNDLGNMIRVSAELSVTYAVLGNRRLARKWAEEYSFDMTQASNN